MPILAVNIIKVCFVAGLYAFLFYVARSMRGHVTGPPPIATPSSREKPPRRMPQGEAAPALPIGRVIEVFDAVGATTRHTIQGVVIVGRGVSADIRIEDDYASDRHASFRTRGSELIVEDLDSTNGTTIDGRPLIGVAEVPSGTTLILGRTKVVVI